MLIDRPTWQINSLSLSLLLSLAVRPLSQLAANFTAGFAFSPL